MKIFIPRNPWVGNFQKYFRSAFKANCAIVQTNSNKFMLNILIHGLKLHQITRIRTTEMQYYLKKYNETVIRECIAFGPDVFFVFNESQIMPDTINEIREKCKCLMICSLGDDPWDSARWVVDFPHSLKYFDIIFCADPTWSNNIRKAAPKAKIFWHYGGFDPEVFKPIERNLLDEIDIKKYSCDLSFSGYSYANKPEGAYRSDILSYLSDFDLKIWGDNWPYRFKFLPELKDKYCGSRLAYDDLIKLYTLTKINLNLPAPQIRLSFQPRVFEIAAVKGFQIIDKRPMLWKLFNDDEIVTFDTIDELREKIKYFLRNDTKRIQLTNNLYNKVINNYTWSHWAKYILDVINRTDAHQEIHEIISYKVD